MGILSNLGQRLKRFGRPAPDEAFLRERDALIRKVPAPTFWLFGKAQSGKSSIIRYLTQADDVQIGSGFRPTTRQSRRYDFPSADAPLMHFLDTRGLGEAQYDPGEDIARFSAQTQLVIVTVRLTDFAQEPVVAPLRQIRAAMPSRPVLLVVTTLHLAYPQQQHPAYPFADSLDPPDLPEAVARPLAAQRERFAGLVDAVVPVDLTAEEEGFTPPDYGGEKLKQAILELLPAAYRQSLRNFGEAMKGLRDLHERRAMPYVLSAASMAASAAAVPVPWVDIPVVAGIQSHMVHRIAAVYGQQLNIKRFLEIAGAAGLGLAGRLALREVVKFIPYVGMVVGAAYAYGATYALGRACCWYYSEVLAGHTPSSEELARVFAGHVQSAQRHLRAAKGREKGREDER
jgi:uncharacterized protein (DUF697 family)